VYLETARRLRRPPGNCLAIEDSANGIRSARAGGLPVIAVPNREFRPPDAVLEQAALVFDDLDDLSPEIIEGLDARERAEADQKVDEQEDESFPASDPHADWAGPAL
jgi:beta-phosphoglucomutase-like phosphatase (HAD superfamily)